MINLSEYFEKMVVILPQFDRITAIPFEEGFSNQVYRLDWDGFPQLVLRVPALDESAFYINRQSEMQILSMAAQAGLSPELLWHDEVGAFVCRYVSQSSFEWSVTHTSENVDRIARALKVTHQLPVVDHTFCIYKVISHYLNGIQRFLSARPELKKEHAYLEEKLGSLERVSFKGSPVVCHNDLNPKNLLMDEQNFWLIDWEYAGMGDPIFDLAVVARSHNLNQTQRQALIFAYEPLLDEKDTLWRLEQYCLAYSLREMTWLLLKHLTTPDDPEALGFYHDFKTMPSLNPFLLSEPTI